MVNASSVQRARTRNLVADVGRQTAAYVAERSERAARDLRIKAALRRGRRAHRARAAARRGAHTAEVAAGAAIRRLRDEGLPIAAAAARVGLGQHSQAVASGRVGRDRPPRRLLVHRPNR